jgi:outer membrane protein
MRELCTRKQYIGKQTELDIKSSIDKKAAIGNFLPSLNANASHS